MPTQVPEPAAESCACVALLPHATRDASGTGETVELLGTFRWLTLELIVTTAVAAATLNVYVQQSHDGGHNWDDLAAFTQLTGSGPEQAQVATVPRREAEAGAELHTLQDGALTAGTVADTVTGRTLRVRWEITGGIGWAFQVLARLHG